MKTDEYYKGFIDATFILNEDKIKPGYTKEEGISLLKEFSDMIDNGEI